MRPNLREQHVGNTSDDNPRCLRSRKEIDRQSGSRPTDAVCLWLAVRWRCRSRVKLLEAQRKHRRKRVTGMGPEAIIDKAMGGRFQSHRVN